ncbi:hypothetical protein F383_18690 [Gossypium arboreum]|uniref:Uncharacterized protein n=1 Tax=Gossypium arboreum TaxID=29729 RepID=A0A0B0NNT7_GOSAR|nr:hypothetical protein F383_18690 [Gossypium arboreum]KHG13475.1 hypothetical protein F383_18690 [Gossypium arboreum]
MLYSRYTTMSKEGQLLQANFDPSNPKPKLNQTNPKPLTHQTHLNPFTSKPNRSPNK